MTTNEKEVIWPWLKKGYPKKILLVKGKKTKTRGPLVVSFRAKPNSTRSQNNHPTARVADRIPVPSHRRSRSLLLDLQLSAKSGDVFFFAKEVCFFPFCFLAFFEQKSFLGNSFLAKKGGVKRRANIFLFFALWWVGVMWKKTALGVLLILFESFFLSLKQDTMGWGVKK